MAGWLVDWMVGWFMGLFIWVSATNAIHHSSILTAYDHHVPWQEFELDEDRHEHTNLLERHEKRLRKTKQAIKLIYITLMVGVAECLPMGFLQILYAQTVTKHDILATLSLVLTWFQLDMKLSKTVDIHGL